MVFKNILFETRDDRIGLLTFNRPDVLNALNAATFDELNDLLDDLEADGSLRGLIVTGTGRAFVAGADLSEIKNDRIEENRRYSARAQRTFDRIAGLPFPTIAAVNGFALGGGCELALACDMRIAGTNAKFGMPEVGLGVIPCFGGTQRLPLIIGVSIAKELIFTGRQVGAAEAKAIGLAGRVLEQENLLDECFAVMRLLMKKSSSAIKYAKLAIDGGREMSLQAGLEFERELSAICYGLPDKDEGFRAFLEKRPPVFGMRD